MGLITNIHRESSLPLRLSANTTMGAFYTDLWPIGSDVIKFVGDGLTDKKASVPNGNRHPVAWQMPLVAGGLSSSNRVTGTGGINPLAMAQGMALDATVAGEGLISEAFAGLIVSAIATLTGSGDITAAELKAYLNAAATLSGSGDVHASSVLAALGWIESIVSGSGTASAQQYATGELGAVIRGYSDLTPEGIRDKVWQALAAEFNEAGTMGNKLNTASSGGVDIDALAQAVWEYATRTLTSGGSTNALTLPQFLALK